MPWESFASIVAVQPSGPLIAGLMALLMVAQPPQAPTKKLYLSFGETRKRVGTERAGEYISALVALVVSWMGSPTAFLQWTVIGSGMMLLLDYATAHKAALLAGEQILSRKLREMMAAKLLSYGMAIWVMLTVALILRSWLPLTAVFGWIFYCEGVSNLENMRKMALASGESGKTFYNGVRRIADGFLGKVPGVSMAMGTATATDTTTTTPDGTTTQTSTATVSTAVVQMPTEEQKVGHE
jgi:hypothetical protein